MSTMFRLLTAGLLLLTCSLALASEPALVGFAQDTLANDWRRAQVEALKREFAHDPNIRFVYTDAQGSTPRQVKDIEDLVHRGVDVLVTSPRDRKTMAPVIADVNRQGIPVVLLTRAVDTDAYTTLIAPDDESIAQNAARYLAEAMDEKGRILVLEGLPSASTAIARTEGFQKVIAKYPDLHIVAIKPGNYLRSRAIAAVEEALQQGISFDAIYAQSDSMASGARIALRRAGVDPADLPIVGIDYISEARESIRQGVQSASFTYPTCAGEAADVIRRILAGRPVPHRVHVKSVRVTAENVDAVAPIF